MSDTRRDESLMLRLERVRRLLLDYDLADVEDVRRLRDTLIGVALEAEALATTLENDRG